MADSVGNAYITISIDPASAAKVKLEAKALGESLGGDVSEGFDKKGGFRRGLNDLEKGLKDGEKGLIDFNKIGEKVAKDLNTRFGGRSYGFPFLSSVAAGFFNVLGKGAALFGDVGNAAQQGAIDFGKWASEGEQASGEMVLLGSTVASIAPLLGAAALGAFAFGAALLVLPGIVAAATFVLVALLDVVTTLTAIFAAFAGPVLLVTGLLGGLGAAFAYVASTVLKANANTDVAHQNLEKLHIAQQQYNEDIKKYGENSTTTKRALVTLQAAQEAYSKSQIGTAIQAADLSGKFDKLIQTLTIRFTPAILDLVHAASQALGFLTKIAQLPLNKAFEELATKGVRDLSKFVYGVANQISKPIRLAISLAFGTGPAGSTTENVLTQWWTSLQRFLFGYTKSHPLIDSKNVFSAKAKGFQGDALKQKGALDPITAFFDRHDFTKAGKEMSDDIIDGFLHSNGAKRLGKFGTDIGAHAGKAAAQAFQAVFTTELSLLFSHGPIDHAVGALITRLVQSIGRLGIAFERAMRTAIGAVGHAAAFIVGKIGDAASSINHRLNQAFIAAAKFAGGAFVGAAQAIQHAIGAAFDWILQKAQDIWNSIKSLFSSVLTLHVSFPSIPSDLKSLLDKGGSLLSAGANLVPHAQGGLITGGIQGVDSVPALLTPGEIVMNEAMQKNLLGMLYNPPKTGRASGSGVEVHVHNYFGGREMNNLIDTRVDMKQRQTKRAIQAGRTAVA